MPLATSSPVAAHNDFTMRSKRSSRRWRPKSDRRCRRAGKAGIPMRATASNHTAANPAWPHSSATSNSRPLIRFSSAAGRDFAGDDVELGDRPAQHHGRVVGIAPAGG